MAIVILVSAFCVCAFLALIAEQLRRGAELAQMTRTDTLVQHAKAETDAKALAEHRARADKFNVDFMQRAVKNQESLLLDYRRHIEQCDLLHAEHTRQCDEWHRRILSAHGIEPERVN